MRKSLPRFPALTLRDLKIARARRSLLAFTEFTFPGYQANWHHRKICHYLDSLVEGKIRKLAIFMPPRHGKALALDTPILVVKPGQTIAKVIYFGEVEVGDRVFTQFWSPSKVIAISKIRMEPTFLVSSGFSDKIRAAADHLWPLDGRLFTTEQLYRFSLLGSPIPYEIRPAGEAAVRCIQIEDPSGLFYVGRTGSAILTHNSELVSRRLPAYILGKNPSARIIATSYSTDLAILFSRDVQRIIESPAYKEVFPQTTLPANSSSWLRRVDHFEIPASCGYYHCAGVGGSITGLGFDFGIIDDIVKNREEAESQTLRNRIYDWYRSTFYTRMEKGARILLTLTRWHEDDLAGRLLKNEDDWVVLKFPALAEEDSLERKEGEALWPEKFDKEELLKIRQTLGLYEWNALYQQRPSALSGNIFQKEWWQFFSEVPEKFELVCQSWDLAFKDTPDSAYVVGQVWGKVGGNFYLLDQFREKVDFIGTLAAIKRMSEKWPEATAKIIEGKANGAAVIATLRQELPGLIEFNPDGSKVARALAVTPLFESGNIYLPRKPWIDDFLDEFQLFPNGRYKDQVDAAVQALLWFMHSCRRVQPILASPLALEAESKWKVI